MKNYFTKAEKDRLRVIEQNKNSIMLDLLRDTDNEELKKNWTVLHTEGEQIRDKANRRHWAQKK